MKTLVVCTEGSDLAIDAAGEGLAILRSSDRVLVVSVIESESSLADDATGHAGSSWTPDELEEQRQAAQGQGRAAVEATISALRARGTLQDNVEVSVVEGEPGQHSARSHRTWTPQRSLSGREAVEASRGQFSDPCPTMSSGMRHARSSSLDSPERSSGRARGVPEPSRSDAHE